MSIPIGKMVSDKEICIISPAPGETRSHIPMHCQDYMNMILALSSHVAAVDFVHSYKVPLGDVVDLKSRGCRKWKTGNTGVRILRIYMSLHVQYVRFAGVVPLLYCAGASEVQRKCGLESSRLCSGWCAHIIRTHECIHTEHRS